MSQTNPFAALEARRIKREQRRSDALKVLADVKVEADEDAVALRVLHQIFPGGVDGSVDAKPTPLALRVAEAAALGGASVVAAIQQNGHTLPVKDQILNILRDAAPHGLTAKQIKGKAVLKYGAKLNPNTLTVSLVRASKSKKEGAPAMVRCEGRTWYYLQQPEAPNVKAPELTLNGNGSARHE